MKQASRPNRCHAELVTGANKGMRCNCDSRSFSQFCGRHQTNVAKSQQNVNLQLPASPHSDLVYSLLEENKKLKNRVNQLSVENRCLRGETEFMREDISGWMNESEALHDEKQFFEYLSNQWIKIALKMNMLIKDIKRQSSSDHIHMVCNQVEYIDMPQEMTQELYYTHDIGFNPYTDVDDAPVVDAPVEDDASVVDVSVVDMGDVD